ncbi:MAG: PKD domain-containing protein, partial [Thermoplasmata archaeon]
TNHTFVNITAHVYGPFNPFFVPAVSINEGLVPNLVYGFYGSYWNSTQAKYFLNLTLVARNLLHYPNFLSNEIQNVTTYISVYPDKTLVEYGTYIPIPNGTYALSSKMTIFNHIIYYNGSLYGFNCPSKLITIQGYVTPHDANIFNIYSLYESTFNQNISNGYYNLTLPANNFILFYNNSYIPQVFYVSSSGWLNVTLQKYTFSYNITPSIFDYNYSKGGILNFSKIPVKASIMSNIIFYKISNNTFYLSSNFTNKLTAYAPLHIILPVLKDRKYLFSIKTNLTTQPYYNYTFNTTNNAYYNFTYDWWGIDPTVSYYAYPVAVITAPTAVAYDSAVLISGANSIPSTNATITNYTWKITGPQNQLYTEYGKTITMYFSITGLYTVTLTVTDSNGLTNTTKTTITVVSANQDLNIQISYSLTILSNGYYQYNITINAKDNVSISQFLASVDSVYVNATLIKQVGYEYYYVVKFNPNAFGYGNHTIKFEAINSLDGYNTAITYATFGSLNNGGILAYILGHIALTIVIIIFIIIILSFIYMEYRHKMIKKISNARRIKVFKNSKRVKK